jgi:hypothetical protein
MIYIYTYGYIYDLYTYRSIDMYLRIFEHIEEYIYNYKSIYILKDYVILYNDIYIHMVISMIYILNHKCIYMYICVYIDIYI